MRRLGKGCGIGLLGIVVTGMTLWGMGVLYEAFREQRRTTRREAV
jgi:hypothetical protein